MDKVKIKQAVFIITYAVFLVIVVLHFDDMLSFLGNFLNLLSPLFVGIAIAFVLDTPYKKLKKMFTEKMKLRDSFAKGISILFVYVITFGLLALLIRFIYPQIAENAVTFAENIDSYLEELQKLINKISGFFGAREVDFSDFIELVNSKIGKIGELAADMLPKIIDVTSSLISWIAEFVIAVVLSIYVMSGQKRLISQVKRLSMAYMPQKMYEKCSYVMEIMIEVFRNYVSGQMLEACILGSLCFLGMLILGLDYAALIGVVVAVTALVPILGAWVGGGLAVLLELFVSPKDAIVFLVFFIILQQLENNLIYPRVVGTKIGLPGIWVLLGVTVGGGLFGIAGMFVGVPAATVLFILLKNDVNRRVPDNEEQRRSASGNKGERTSETEAGNSKEKNGNETEEKGIKKLFFKNK